ncbi:hypothetical protein GGI12_004220 [Dipsacomyces acuminosporus]|nr:hypothetical protein GGI12_004220 [Dipsacomyces acuminosporus]
MSYTRTSKPYFRFKRGTVSVFVETSATESLSRIKQRMVQALQQHGDEFKDVAADSVQLAVAQSAGSNAQYRQLDESISVGESGLVDDQVIFFVLQKSNGTWEEPAIADYDSGAVDAELDESFA